jgi:hypothetical protein
MIAKNICFPEQVRDICWRIFLQLEIMSVSRPQVREGCSEGRGEKVTNQTQILSKVSFEQLFFLIENHCTAEICDEFFSRGLSEIAVPEANRIQDVKLSREDGCHPPQGVEGGFYSLRHGENRTE